MPETFSVKPITGHEMGCKLSCMWENTWIILRNASAPWFKIIGLGESSWSTYDGELPRQVFSES